MAFHYSTLMFFSSMVSFLIVILFICFILFTKSFKFNIIVFTLGRGIIVIGIIGIVLRGTIPDLLSLTVSNILIQIGTAATILGILSYNNIVHKKMVWLLSAIVITASLFYILSIDSYSHRSFVIYISTGLLTLIGGVTLFLRRETYKFPIFISVMMLIYAIGRLVFAFKHLDLPDNFNPMQSSTVSQLFVPFFSILSMAISVGFLLLLREVDVRIIEKNLLELEKHNTNKDELLRMIAHDLRSPFNTILGFSEILVESSKKDSLEEIQKFAFQINRSAQHAYESTNNLLEWVLANTNHIKPNITKQLIDDFIKKTTLEFSNITKEKKIKIIYEVSENLEANFDINILGSILRNLLGNAIKFSPENKSIIIKAGIVNNRLEFIVIDQGIGIEKDKLKTFFSTKIKSSTPGTKGERGSGLGLSICYELIQKHSGEIHVESDINKGSAFSFSVPQG